MRELLGDDYSFHDARPPPLVDVFSRIHTPAIESAVASPHPRRLTPRQTRALVERLSVVKNRAVSPPVEAKKMESLMNPKSAHLAQGLEPINVRAPKLLKAKERRLERLVELQISEERKSMTAQPAINQKSHEIAQRLTPARRQEIVDERKRILLEETKENCSFQPTINAASDRFASRRNSFSVTDRLLRDTEMRKQKHERLVELRERELMADCRAAPEISDVAKSFFAEGSVAPVHERLYPRSPPRVEMSSTRSKSAGPTNVSRTVVPFSQYWNNVSVADSVQLAPFDTSIYQKRVAQVGQEGGIGLPGNATRSKSVSRAVQPRAIEESMRESSRMSLSGIFAFTKRSSN